MRQIWRAPGRVVAQIAHENPWYRSLAWPVFASFAWWPGHILSQGEVERDVGLIFHLLLVFPVGLELPLQFMLAWFIYVSARRFGGRAAFAPTVTVLAWSNMPIAMLALVSVPLSFIVEFPLDSMDMPSRGIVMNTSFCMTLAIIAWSWWILVNGLARIQGYTRTRALTHTLVCAGLLTVASVALLLQANGFEFSSAVLFENWAEFVVIPESEVASSDS